MSIPLACEVSEHLSDNLLAERLVFSLVVSEAEVLVALLEAELDIRFVKLGIVITLNDFLFLAFFWHSKQVHGC